jgi:hypothetical protein
MIRSGRRYANLAWWCQKEASRYSRVNTQAGALSLVFSRLFFFTEALGGHGPLRQWLAEAPEVLRVNLEASLGGSPLGETRPHIKPHRR